MTISYKHIALVSLLLAGCMSQPAEPVDPVVIDSETMTYLKSELQPEVLLFPNYLFMEDFEMIQHGYVPETNLVGADMKTQLCLRMVYSRFSQLLDSLVWHVDQTELGRKSFRIIASRSNGEQLELRAVQGTGPTAIFLLYTPPETDQ